jgi:beta-xylosidase
MESEEQYIRNRDYYRAAQYLRTLLLSGEITEEQMKKALAYYARLFETKMIIG